MLKTLKPLRKPVVLLVKCPRCGHIWYTRAMLGYVTCPNCHTRFNKYKNTIEEPPEEV